MDEDRKHYLMKRRRYGWGWIPVTWQAWVFLIAQIAIVFIAATSLPHKPAQPTADQLMSFFAILVLVVINMIIFSLQTSPSPKWRWGKKSTDTPDEDF